MNGRGEAEHSGDAVEGVVFRAEPGTLYVVATPLGNLRDLTLRARDILQTVDVIAAEDTRVTAILLGRYGIATRPTSVHAHNEARRAADVVAMLGAGRSVALVSDAGTPAISDPGARVVAAVRAAGFRVIPIPGTSALTAALSVAGLHEGRFLFAGFLPTQAKARRALLARVESLALALVVYEAPHRVRSTMEDLAAALPGRDVVIARELTKAFETIERMPIGEAAQWIAADPRRERGEFVLIVDAPPAAAEEAPTLSADVERWLAALLVELSPSRAASVAAAASGVSRETLYARALALKRGADGG